MNESLSSILIFYGLFLIACGIASVIFIGLKAKTALISGGTSGAISLTIAYLFTHGFGWFWPAGIFFSFALFIVFSWRATKTLFSVFDMIKSNHPDLKSKGIAFLIISLMAVVSITVIGLQAIFVLRDLSI